jgi:hypothetical protein
MNVHTRPAVPDPVTFRHEHLLQVNSSDPQVIPLTRAQLWDGLVETIRVPEEHDSSIDASVVVSVSANVWRRRCARGSTVVADLIELTPQSRIVATVEEGPFTGSRSIIAIEEKAPRELYVRIVHEVRGPAVMLSPEEEQARRAAYEAANIDRVSRARAVALHLRSPPKILDS